MNRTLLSVFGGSLGALTLAGAATGAITVYAEYHLGEAGSLADLAADNVGIGVYAKASGMGVP